MIDFHSSSSSICTDSQKRDEQTMGSLQSRNEVADRRAEPDEERAADSSVVTGGSDPPDPTEEITEQWHDDLHEWYICRDDQCPVESSPRESPVMSPRSEATTDSVRVSNAVSSPPAQTARYRRNMSATPTAPQETLVSCFHRSHQLLPGSNAVSVSHFLDCRHHAKWTHRMGPTFQQFRELQQMVQAWWAKL